MSRPSFRPRPIDLNKQLPIIKTNRDLKHDEDNVAVARALPAMATGVDPTEEEERHLQQALLASIYGEDRRKAFSEIPIPVVQAREYDTSEIPKFEPPEEYIAFNRNDEELENTTVEYELDRTDEKALRTWREKDEITDDDFEVAIDRMEKTQGRPVELIPFSVMKNHLSEVLPTGTPESLIEKIYNHWVHRRKVEREGRPFLRLLQPAPKLNDPNPAVAFRQRDDFPFGSGRARQARQNTYENFKRLLKLSSDFDQLRKVLDRVQKREQLKRDLTGLRIDATRVSVTQQMYSELAASEAAKSKQASEATRKALHISSAAAKKQPRAYDASKEAVVAPVKKKKRHAVSVKGPGTEKIHMVDSLLSSKASSQQGMDQFSFDEKGRAFLRQMRYIAGWFATNGVSPYDHRVFAAASDRNYVKDFQKEFASVDFPSQVKFAKVDNNVLIRAMPRVGRLGRVFFDPIRPVDKQQRATTYAASTQLGGAYSASLPFEKLSELHPLGLRDTVTETFTALEPSGIVNASAGESAGLVTQPSKESGLHETSAGVAELGGKRRRDTAGGSTSPADVLPFYAPRRKSIVLDFD